MSVGGKVEFCSPAWLAHAGRIVPDLVAEYASDIRGDSISICEIFLNPPEHLRSGVESYFCWSFAIENGRLVAPPSTALRRDYEMLVEVEYFEALPRACTVHSDDPAAVKQRRREREARIGRPSPIETRSAKLQEMLLKIHNRLAVLTA